MRCTAFVVVSWRSLQEVAGQVGTYQDTGRDRVENADRQEGGLAVLREGRSCSDTDGDTEGSDDLREGQPGPAMLRLSPAGRLTVKARHISAMRVLDSQYRVAMRAPRLLHHDELHEETDHHGSETYADPSKY